MSETMIRKNHMDVLWHEYTDKEGQNLPVVQASLTEKASIIGRAGIMLLSCGTGAWRVRSSMNTLAEVMGVTCTADIGLMSIEYTCFDGQDGFTQSLCLTNTGVNTSKLNRLEHFIQDFETEEKICPVSSYIIFLIILKRFMDFIHRLPLVSLPLLPAEDLPFCLAADRLKCFVLLSELVSETF